MSTFDGTRLHINTPAKFYDFKHKTLAEYDEATYYKFSQIIPVLEKHQRLQGYVTSCNSCFHKCDMREM